MHNRRTTVWASLLLAVVLALSGCAPQTVAGLYAVSSAIPAPTVDLPALVVDVSETGEASVGNVPVAQLAGMAGVNPASLSIPEEWVAFLTASNIQHVQLKKIQNSLLVLINGEPIPSLTWDGESLSATNEVLADFGITVPLLDQFLPLLNAVNMAVIVRFPVAADQAAIPLYVESSEAAELVQQAQDHLAVAGETHLTLPVYYQADGSWTVGELTSAQLTTMTGISFYALNLRPHAIDALARAGVHQLSLSTDAEGVHISVNGKTLPTITWRNGELANLVELTAGIAEQYDLVEAVAPGMSTSEIVATVRELLPIVVASDFELVVHMPTRDMAVSR